MTLKPQAPKVLRALGTMGAAGLVGALAFAAPANADTKTIWINQGNVPTTAADFEQSCDQVPDSIGSDEDGWVFVLPGNSGSFISITATYEDADGDSWTFDTDADGGIDPGNGTSKAYIITPAGWTLTGATAEVDDTAKDKFNLTHACAGTPAGDGEETPTPGGETPTPEEETTAPGEGTTAPGEDASPSGAAPSDEASTTPSAALPTTGTPLTVALLAAAALAAAGAAALFLVKRRRTAEDW